MDSRRDFLKKAALLAAGSGLAGAWPGSIQTAFAIDPEPGSTCLDAEYVVVLMQENRSFDHTFGMLRGVRGFNDPRAVTLPDGNPVWLQSNAQGETYAPFRFNIKDTKATWMGSLPHGWIDQGEARNNGRHDRWLIAKASSDPAYAHLPLTLGFYSRADIPFYYALADAFTVCDQSFCSSLTATEPNRLHLWTGTVRKQQNNQAYACVRNEDLDYDAELDWMTFPERLEAHGISWRIYQNEINLPTGLSDDEMDWLSNFQDNPLEYFKNYHIRFSATRRRYLVQRAATLEVELNQLESAQPHSSAAAKQIADHRRERERIRHELATWTEAAFAQLPAHEQSLFRNAFATNAGDRDYRELTTFSYRDGDVERQMQVPKGDPLFQFRQDVCTGKLPTVSWIVAPAKLSDHPCAPWYGAWYISEALDILTRNPAVWKKTIFILCYDENDGYFDHVPPFVPPWPNRPETGKVSAGIDPAMEYVSAAQQAAIRRQEPDWKGQAGPIGLGFRVPLVIASPWSRGGYVCSQVFDHTSILQFLEKLLTRKLGRPIRESNISAWRRLVCGDLTAAFRPYRGEKLTLPSPVERDAFLGTINQAQYRPIPDDYRKLSAADIAQARKEPATVPWLAQQEPGIRAACALPYELAVDGLLSADRKSFGIRFAAGKERFGERSAGAPFRVYAPGRGHSAVAALGTLPIDRAWDYAVAAGDSLGDVWPLEAFENGGYRLHVHGPNGFFREFRGTAEDPRFQLSLQVGNPTRTSKFGAILHLTNQEAHHSLLVEVEDLSHGGTQRTVKLGAGGQPDAVAKVNLDLNRSYGWYDLSIRVPGAPAFQQRYAGRVETGLDSFSDPQMARGVSKTS